MTSLLPQIKKISESLTIDDVQNRYSLLELFLDTVIVTDKLGKIVYINESVFNLLGYKRQELIDKNISTIIYDKDSFRGTLTNIYQNYFFPQIKFLFVLEDLLMQNKKW